MSELIPFFFVFRSKINGHLDYFKSSIRNGVVRFLGALMSLPLTITMSELILRKINEGV